MNIMEIRQDVIRTARTIVVKVGSAVLADENSLDYSILNSIATQISIIRNNSGQEFQRRVILVSSGAVAAGKTALKAIGISGFPNYTTARHAIAAVGQSLLMQAWNVAFAPHNIITGQVLLTRDDLRNRKRFHTAAGTFTEMLSWDVVPIVNENDTVSVSDLKFGDNDCLASLLVNLVEADLFVNLTSAPGVLDASPDENPNARVLECIEDIGSLDLDSLCGCKTGLGSGGMHSKLLAARRVSQIGVPTLVLPGREKNVLVNAFSGEGKLPGTWINAASQAIPRRKFWLAYQADPAGAVQIDDGAANALLYKGGSLLPGGVTGVEGNFEKGALLRVIHKGKNLGIGFSNYSSEELQKIKGLKRHEVAAILGQARYPDVIHRDNLLMDAAI